MTDVDPYPTYSRAERIADAVVHAIGLLFAILGTVALILWAMGQDPAQHIAQRGAATVTGVSIYGAALIGSFLASACYHFTPWEGPRHLLQRIDHAAIYLKIAGTYTPLVVLIGSAFAYGVLAVVWALAALGAIAKLFFWSRQGRWSTAFYLCLGWISVALLSSLWPLLPTGALVCLFAGGLIYSAGAVVFSLDHLKFQNAIWHGFVLTASACFFAAIALGAFA